MEILEPEQQTIEYEFTKDSNPSDTIQWLLITEVNNVQLSNFALKFPEKNKFLCTYRLWWFGSRTARWGWSGAGYSYSHSMGDGKEEIITSLRLGPFPWYRVSRIELFDNLKSWIQTKGKNASPNLHIIHCAPCSCQLQVVF